MARRLKEARREAGLKQTDAARAIGVDPNTIWRYENDRLNPSNSALLALSYTYGKPIGWFRGLVDEDPPRTPPADDDEQRFLAAYRGVPAESRRLVLTIMEAAAKYEIEQKEADLKKNGEALGEQHLPRNAPTSSPEKPQR